MRFRELWEWDLSLGSPFWTTRQGKTPSSLVNPVNFFAQSNGISEHFGRYFIHVPLTSCSTICNYKSCWPNFFIRGTNSSISRFHSSVSLKSTRPVSNRNRTFYLVRTNQKTFLISTCNLEIYRSTTCAKAGYNYLKCFQVLDKVILLRSLVSLIPRTKLIDEKFQGQNESKPQGRIKSNWKATRTWSFPEV